ncbi:MAG TPA: hypothetical protein V6C98_01250, partial [Thermosynechococcaceae cyanobacterium]
MRRRWGIVLTLGVAIALTLTGCQLRQFRTQAAQGSQLVISTITDPNTFNFANKNTFPSIFLFAYDCLTTEN